MEVLIFKNNNKKNLLKVLVFFLAFSYLCFLIISGKEGA